MSNELVVVDKVEGGLSMLEGREGNFQLIQKEMNIPPDLVYKISKGSGGFYASLYDVIAREIGIQFLDANVLHEDDFRVLVKITCQYWNKSGKLVSDTETYGVDTKNLYEKARFGYTRNAVDKNGKWIWGNGGYVVEEDAKDCVKVIRDKEHPENPPMVIVELSDKAEAELYENFLTLRRNKLAKCITCCHRRLIQRAIGIKNFAYDPKDKKKEWNEGVGITFYGFLPANADKKAGIQAVVDVTGEELPPEKNGNGKKERVVTGKEIKNVEKKKEVVKKQVEKIKKGEEKKVETPSKDALFSKEINKGKSVGDADFNSFCTNPACGAGITDEVATYSKNRYGKFLCRVCQKLE